MISKKIAMLGMWGVGKTSLVQQYVHSIYDEKYHSTLGVKVDKKVVESTSGAMTLMLWDIAGAEDRFAIPLHYVKGAAGYLLVVDGTRRESLERAADIVSSIEDGVGKLPFITVVNKADLEWEITLDEVIDHLNTTPELTLETSAKTGVNVEAAFMGLANLL